MRGIATFSDKFRHDRSRRSPGGDPRSPGFQNGSVRRHRLHAWKGEGANPKRGQMGTVTFADAWEPLQSLRVAEIQIFV